MLAIGLNLSSSVINIVELANKGRNIIVRKVVKAEVPADCIITVSYTHLLFTTVLKE